MPLPGNPAAAANKAAARGDHRLMAYRQGGFAISLVVAGVRHCDAAASATEAGNGDFRLVAISLDDAATRQCCDHWVPDRCGLRQQDYAAAYNSEMIRVARRRLKCRELLVEPRLR